MRLSSLLAPLCLGLACVCFGCSLSSPNEPEPTPIPGPSEECSQLFTYAPGFLIVDLAAGSIVTLDPSIRDFPVYCSAAAAKQGLADALAAHNVQAGDWQIYALAGSYAELGKAIAPGRYVLARPAKLQEWIKP